MSKLKKIANHVSPEMHQQVIDDMTNPEANSSRVLLSKIEFVIAKRLLADLPIVPTNERTYELMQDIIMGLFNDISDVEQAEQNWDAWKQRTMELLKARGILASKRLRK